MGDGVKQYTSGINHSNHLVAPTFAAAMTPLGLQIIECCLDRGTFADY